MMFPSIINILWLPVLVQCEYEFVLSDLTSNAAATTTINWQDMSIPAPYLTTFVTTCPGTYIHKTLQGTTHLKGIVPWTPNRIARKLSISLDLYYFQDWSTDITITVNQIIRHYGMKSQTGSVTTTQFCSIAGQVDSYERITMEFDFLDTALELDFFSTGNYGISNVLIYAQFCSYKCIDCRIIFEVSTCIQCAPLYALDNDRICKCTQFLHYVPSEQCITACPTGYLADSNNVCQLITEVVIFSDLIITLFTNMDFLIVEDHYCTTSITNRIMTINTKNVAGPFRCNEAITYDVSIASPARIRLTGTLYFLGASGTRSQLYRNVMILLNSYGQSQFIEFMDIMAIGARITQKSSCTVSGFSHCTQVTFDYQVDIQNTITQLQIRGFFEFNNPDQAWGIRDVILTRVTQVTQYPLCESPCATCSTSQTICLTCLLGLKQFDGVCLPTCPFYTTDVAGVCQDPDYSLSDTTYLIKILYDTSYFEDDESYNQIGNTLWQNLNMKFTNIYNGRMMFGGFSSWGNAQFVKDFTKLAPHYKIILRIDILFIDFNVGDKFYITIDTNVVMVQPTAGINTIGHSLPEQLQNHRQDVSHSATSLRIMLQCVPATGDGNCAVMNYFVLMKLCPPYCSACNSLGVCVTPMVTPLYSSPNCQSGYYLNERECIACTIGCATCNKQGCLTCKTGYQRFGLVCYCNTNTLIPGLHDCSSCKGNCQICTSGEEQCLGCDVSKHLWLSVNQCVCLNGYYMEESKCELCFPTCQTCVMQPRLCLSCYPEQFRILAYQGCDCMEGYFQEDADITCSQCDGKCLSCKVQKTMCWSCKVSQFRHLIDFTCYCIDGYYDDGSLECKECHQKCQTCIDFDFCLSCKISQGRQLSIYGKECVCMAGYYDVAGQMSCNACHLSCQACLSSSLSNMCTRCQITRQPSTKADTFTCDCQRGFYEVQQRYCTSCKDYLNPPSTHYCYSKCNDGIVQWDEDCDDGNNNSKDDCINCHFKNSPCNDALCLSCFANKCTSCIDGYYLDVNSRCKICDSICKKCVNKPNNCTECTIQTPNGCLQCVTDRGFQLVEDKCFNICGDGIVVEGEQCDDGNQINEDGCNSECQVEDGWICQEICEKIEYPVITLVEDEFDTRFTSLRSVKMTASQPMQVAGSMDSNTKITVQNCDQYSVKQSDLTNYGEPYVEIDVAIEAHLLQETPNPILTINIIQPDNFMNKQGLQFEDKPITLELLNYLPPSDSVITSTEALAGFSEYILYLMLGLAVLAFLFGGLHIFWNLLDMLQLLSYLKYLNVQYPYNVTYYFTLFGFAEFDFLKQYIDIETFISQYVDTPDADPKFKQEGYSSVFIVNIVAVATVFLVALVTYFGCIFAIYLIKKVIATLTKEQIDDCDQSVFQFFAYRVTRSMQMSLVHMQSEYCSGLLRTFMAVAYDYNIAIFLQLKDFNFSSQILLTSGILSLIALLVEIIFIYKATELMSQPKYYFKLKSTEYRIGSLYEGLKIGNNKYTYHMNIIVLIKKVLFMMFLVLLYNEPCMQITSVVMLNLLFAAYLLKIKPMEEEDEQFKTFWSEIILWVAELLILIFAFNEQSQQINDDGQLQLGWAVIVVCSLLIVLQLIIDIKQHAIFLAKEYMIIRKLMERLGQYWRREVPEQESNIFLRSRNMKKRKENSKSNLKIRKQVTFSLHSSNGS